MADNKSPASPLVSDHLANERTYLAWLRTSFSLLTLGFATNKFGQFLFELHAKSGQKMLEGAHGTRRFGIGMAVLGTLLMGYATWSYNSTRKQIDSGDFRPHSVLIWVVGLGSIAFGATAVLLLVEQS